MTTSDTLGITDITIGIMMSTADLHEEFEQMVRGEIIKMPREEFRDRCDEDDRFVYLSVARKIAKMNRFTLHVHEDELEFVCPPPSKL